MKKFSSASQKVGLLGEDIACKYLISKGFTILERNYTKKWGEIDIVAREKSRKLRFIEVKSVSCENIDGISPASTAGRHETSIRPEENMHPKKMERMARTVETYLSEKDVRGDWQVDLVTVFIDEVGKRAKVKLWEDVILG
jgi:putative endonuclease